MTRIAVCPGSYDPITVGHLDVVRRALELADEVIIGVAHNAVKKYLFDGDTRVRLAREAVDDAGLTGVVVEPIEGLLATYIKDRGVTAIVKGLRDTADFENERTMALINRQYSGVDTYFVLGDQSLTHVASSFVKELASYGADVSTLVPPSVNRALMQLKETHD